MKKRNRKYWLHMAELPAALTPFWADKLLVNAAAYDFLNDAGNDKLKKAVDAVKKEGAGYVVLWQTIGAVSVLCAVMACGLALAVKKNANMRAETKERLLYICMAGIGIFSITTILSILQSLGMGLK